MFDIKNIPYNKLELTNAINEYVDRVGEEVLDDITNMITDIIPNNISDKQINIMVAEYHGIILSELLASPNMQKLSEMWSEFQLDRVYNELINIGMTDIESTALIYFSLAGTD